MKKPDGLSLESASDRYLEQKSFGNCLSLNIFVINKFEFVMIISLFIKQVTSLGFKIPTGKGESMAVKPLAKWEGNEDLPDKLVWWTRLDGRYQIEVQRLSDRNANLFIFDHEDGDKLLLCEKVSLAYGAEFGPDISDVGWWEERCLMFIDNLPGRRKKTEMKLMKGVCTFYSETGTEGGYWAFIDSKFMHIPDDTLICAKCHYYKDYIEGNTKGAAIVVASSTPLSEALKSGERKPCPDGEHKWKKAYPRGRMSYEGLHILEDTDVLIIFSKERNKKKSVVWAGEIKLKQLGLFTDSAFGMWIHADQEGVERDIWARYFLDEHPALLVKK